MSYAQLPFLGLGSWVLQMKMLKVGFSPFAIHLVYVIFCTYKNWLNCVLELDWREWAGEVWAPIEALTWYCRTCNVLNGLTEGFETPSKLQETSSLSCQVPNITVGMLSSAYVPSDSNSHIITLIPSFCVIFLFRSPLKQIYIQVRLRGL